ncbi:MULTISPECIES: hypothetical protein [Variovorax]|uniref:hypothetical protein n=1 Tax=Variovorax TaxID=34072 RepID=UPI00285D6E39|nr:hypothetical protein [Variovorax sp. 3319]MDR6890890.1 hypothetical protein [Variovorax sp. 3319]
MTSTRASSYAMTICIMLALLPTSSHAEFESLSPIAIRNLSKIKRLGPCVYNAPAPGSMRGHVGFIQAEIHSDGENCQAMTLQKAVQFDKAKLHRLNAGRINRAILVFDEKEGADCKFVVDPVRRTCWQSGGGRPEHKPVGCVLVKVPSINWVGDNTQRGEMPTHERAPQINRIGPGRYDVTEAFRWQFQGAPLGTSPGVGFLLQGHIPFGRLTAQDNTICVSAVSNIRIEVDYSRATGQPPRLR